MPMTVVVTRDVSSRFRGFLASCMLQITPGVYSAPRLSRSVRERIWTVLNDWYSDFDDTGVIIMTWPDKSCPGGQAILTLGTPTVRIVEVDGMFLAYRPYTKPDESGEAEVQNKDI